MDNEILWLIGTIGLTGVILNVIILGTIISARKKEKASQSWRAVKGTVISSRIEQRHSSNNRSRVDYPIVNYSYQVGEKTYHGDKIAPGYEVGGTRAASIVNKYPEGKGITVFYDPENPSEAFLERKAPAQWGMWLALAIINIMLAAMIFLFTSGS